MRGSSLTPAPPPTSASQRVPRATLAILAAVVVVIASVVVIEIVESGPSHVVCVGVTRVGNVSAWYPYAFAAAPFDGAVEGYLHVWLNDSVAGATVLSKVPVAAEHGNVTIGWAAGGNWSVFYARNSTVAGAGPALPCTGPMIAFLGPPNAAAAEQWGGGTVASGLRVDSGLPSSFNASLRCAVLAEAANCAVSADFDLNFSTPEGMVDTCGSTAAALDVVGQQLAFSIPFTWNGVSRSVPAAQSSVSGMIGWFNYTFPANGGIWQYDTLPGVNDSGSGLVFSYSPCP